jgi:hypothetical protein
VSRATSVRKTPVGMYMAAQGPFGRSWAHRAGAKVHKALKQRDMTWEPTSRTNPSGGQRVHGMKRPASARSRGLIARYVLSSSLLSALLHAIEPCPYGHCASATVVQVPAVGLRSTSDRGFRRDPLGGASRLMCRPAIAGTPSGPRPACCARGPSPARRLQLSFVLASGVLLFLGGIAGFYIWM